MSAFLSELLERSAARHDHLCPRQVLGVRMGLAGLALLGLEPPLTKLTGLVIVETDGCFVDGIEVATGATIGHRTLRVRDFGKLAATFASLATGRCMRVSPQANVREVAQYYARGNIDRYAAQLAGYQVMPDGELFHVQDVMLDPSLEELLSNPEARALCAACGEEVINERESVVEGKTLCRSCAGEGYYLSRSKVVETNPY